MDLHTHENPDLLPQENLFKTPLPSFTAARELEQELRKAVRGEIRFDDGSRALYATDGSNYRQVPIGVVLPLDNDDVIAAVDCAQRLGAPILARGGGTSLAGQCCNTALLLDMSKYMNTVLEIDPEKRVARIQPGLILDDLRNAAEKHHLTFGPDPATHTHCTLGGMIGNNSCGIHSLMAGKTVDNIEEMEILTYDGLRMRVGRTSGQLLDQIIGEGGRRGQIYSGLRKLGNQYADLIRERYPKIPRRVSGYNLDELLPESEFNVARALVGSESTCVVVLEALVRLVHSPQGRSLVVLGFDDIYQAGDRVTELLEFKPIGLEAVDDRLVSYMRKKGLHPDDVAMLPDGNSWLLVEFGGDDKKDSDDKAQKLIDHVKKNHVCRSAKLFDNPREEKRMWEIRESGLGATAIVPGMPNTWPGWEDSAIAPGKVGQYLRDLRKLFDSYQLEGALYGHFGQGCIHVRISFDLETAKGVQRFVSFMNDAADLVVSYGGSLSGEHGDGQARAAFLPKMYGPELIQAFREFKALWDPGWKMNPGKVVSVYRPDENLRLGASFKPWTPATHFHFRDDGGFARATMRCVGVGECRRLGGATMCPSFMVTREEKHSTRGRARLLFEMTQGEVIGRSGWKDEAVKEALDLCLACKGCKGDCPVNVDMATYKAEFYSHYYEGRIRPRSAYAFGLIYWWARAAAVAPGLVNALTRAPGISSLMKAIAGMAPERKFPQFASQTFTRSFSNRNPSGRLPKDVILWPDTFNNHFHPATAEAAVRVLQAAGRRVRIPQQSLCCGRPLYDFGMLNLAKKMLRRTLDALQTDIRNGTPVVVLEPSCAAVFRDEMLNLFPQDEDAKRLAQQTFLIGEFLEREAPDFHIPALQEKALIHLHCHHRAVMDVRSAEQLVRSMQLDGKILNSGCCGMAGSFGFEEGEHYDISVKEGERVLLPAVREADDHTLIIADGFSCREQIAQCTGRKALHFAEVLDMGLNKEKGGHTVNEWWAGEEGKREEKTRMPVSSKDKPGSR